MSAITAEEALRRFLALLDGEDWEQLIERLAPDVELADELTATWLRGRRRVAAYLRAQTGVVTDIHSTASDVAARVMKGGDVLVTFNLHQRYRLDGADRKERMTGCAVFTSAGSDALLSLFHLGETARMGQQSLGEHEEVDDLKGAQVPPAPEDRLGNRIRARREAAGFTLRALASASGLSASFLSQVERSQADPSVTSLRRIAEALGTTAPALLLDEGGTERETIRTGRAEERPQTALHELGLRVEAFPGLRDSSFVSWITELAGDAPEFAARAAGVERFVYVLSGTLAAIGAKTTILDKGEGAHLDGRVPYRLASGLRDAPVRFLSVQELRREVP